VSKQHLDLFPLIARGLASLGLGDLASQIVCAFADRAGPCGPQSSGSSPACVRPLRQPAARSEQARVNPWVVSNKAIYPIEMAKLMAEGMSAELLNKRLSC
jgi:hypothetical protein